MNAMARPRRVLTMREDTIMMCSFDYSVFGLHHLVHVNIARREAVGVAMPHFD
jgi:hypothetical protein